MPLESYARAARGLVSEILDQLVPYGFETLETAARETGRTAFHRYCHERQDELLAYVEATPSQRAKKLAKIQSDQRWVYLLAASYWARVGLAMLEAVTDHRLGPGGSNRSMLGSAATAAGQLLDGWPSLWPFDDGRDPFGEGLD